MITRLPAGRYFLGDPCYAIDSNSWHEVLDDNDFFESDSKTFDQITGSGTAYGDGTYIGVGKHAGVEFSVDAGLIGLVGEKYWSGRKDEAKLNQLGTIIEMKRPFTFEANSGVFYIDGQIFLDTGYDAEECQDDEYEYEDEYNYEDDF